MLVSLILTILAIALIGFLVHLIVSNIPMEPPFKQLIVVVTVVLITLYLLLIVTGQVSMVKLR